MVKPSTAYREARKWIARKIYPEIFYWANGLKITVKEQNDALARYEKGFEHNGNIIKMCMHLPCEKCGGHG